VLLTVLTVIATLGQFPAPAAAATGGAGQVEQEPTLADTPGRSALKVGTATWQSLLNFTPYRVRWSGSRVRLEARASSRRVGSPSRPLSATLRASSHEIDPGPAP
jgi:hypothetical protein